MKRADARDRFGRLNEMSGMRCLSCHKPLRWGQVTCLCGDMVNMPLSDRRLLRPRIR
jgi:hypothetical protein